MTVSASPRQKTVVIAANSAWNIHNFRRPLVEALIDNGWRVVAVAGDDDSADKVRLLGAEFLPIAIDPSGKSVLRDGRLFLRYRQILRDVRPQAFLGFTVKPNIYGSLAARLWGVRAINNISGLGSAFIGGGLLGVFVRQLYRLALRQSHRVFFQNAHDMDLFVRCGIVGARQAMRIPGSGVDLEYFRPRPKTGGSRGRFRFLFIGRLLRDKGLVEYMEAARILRTERPDLDFCILGFAGSDNPTAVPLTEVERWHREGFGTYLGETDDVRPEIADADCVVLPSYREGLPRTLLEAAAMAKPMIATDVPGCNDVVSDGVNGLLCEARSPEALAIAMELFLQLPDRERGEMGQRARERVEREFDQARVVQAYLKALE